MQQNWFRVVDLNIGFFISAELFEWFWKICEMINIWVVFRRPSNEKDYWFVLAGKEQKE